MSKSLGNFLTIRDVLAQYNAEVVRYFMLASHYRSPINYSHDNLESAQMALSRLYLCLRGLPLSEPPTEENEFSQRFHEAMNDDFNTPLALAALFDLSREINRLQDSGDMQEASRWGALLRNLSAILGIGQQEPEDFLRLGIANEEAQKIERIIAARNEARNTKQWAKADELRDQLLAMGVVIEDTAQGTVWRK